MATEADHIIPESISIAKHEESPGIVKPVGTISEKEIKPEDAKRAVEAEENPQCVEQEAEKGSERAKGDQNSGDQGFSGVEDIKLKSTVHEGEVESDLVVKTAPVTYETATSREDDKIITNVEEEGEVTEDDIREEKVVKESNNTSTVKCEEGEQVDGTQKTREFSDEENKENETPKEKVFETASKEQEIGERALREVYAVADAPHVYVREEENLDTKESLLQKQIPTTDETSLGVETTNVQGEENLESKDKLEEQIPTAAEEDFSSSKGRLEKQITSSNPDAETENKEPDEDVEGSEDIVNGSAVKCEETSTKLRSNDEDDSPRDLHNFEGEEIEEKEIQETEEYSEQEKKEENLTAKEKAADLSEYREEKNLEEQDIGGVPSSLIGEEKTKEIAEEEEIFEGLKEAEEEKKEIEDVYVQAEENFDSNESLLEKQISTAADEEVYVQAEENFESIEKLEERISIAEDRGEVLLKEAEAEKEEQIPATADEIVKEAQTAENTEEIVGTSQMECEEGQLGEGNIPDSEKAPMVSESDSQSIDGHEANLKDTESKNKEQVKNTDIVHEEKGVETILTGERSLEVEDIDVKGEESEPKENLEKIPTEAADESETLLKEAETENKEHKGQETVVANGKALDIEEENFNSEQKLENQNCNASEEGEDKTTDQQSFQVKSFQVKSLEEADTKVGVEDKILKEEQTAEKSEEIVDASQVECEESQLEEGNIPDSDKATMEVEGSDREIFPVKVAEEDDDKNGSVTDSVQASETSLEEEGDREAPELVPEKLDVDATEDEIIEGSEIVPRSDSHQSIDVASKDEVITYQSLHVKISAEELQKPSATLLHEEIEMLKPSQHEDIVVPVDEEKGDLFATRSAEDTVFQKEEPGDLGASEFVLEKLDAGETEEGTKEAFEPVLKSDSQNIDAVSKHEIIADQSVLETKISEVSLDEKEGELLSAKEEPTELKDSELALAKLDVDETKKKIKEAFESVSKSDSQITDVVSKDKAICYQALHELLVPEENEIKVSQCEIGTTTQDKNKEEKHKNEVEIPDDKNMEVALSQKEGHEDVEVSKSRTKETYEPTPEFASQSVDVVTKDEISSSTLFTDETSDGTTLTSTAEAAGFLKEEPRELKASDFELQISPEVQRGGSSELLEEQGSSLKEVPKVVEEERADDSPDPSNLDIETSDKASDFGFTKSQEATILEIRSEVATEANETTKNEVSNEEVHEVHENGSQGGKAEKLVESGDTSATDHIPYEIKVEDEELPKGSVPESITEDNHQGEKAIENEIIKGSDLVSKSDSHQSIDIDSKDEIITYQTQLHEVVLAEQIQIPSAILLPEEIQELKPSQHKHETATQDKNAEEEGTEEKEVLVAARGEPLAAKVSELAPIKLDANENEEETKEISETVSEFVSPSIDVVSKDEIISYQALHEILVPKEKEIKVSECELGTTVQDKNIEAEHKHELDIPDDKNMEEKLVQTEEPKDVEVSDLSLKTVHTREEPSEDDEEERFDDPRLENLHIETSDDKALENLHIETSDDKASDFAKKEGFIKPEDAISDSKAEENQCETTTEENKTRKIEASDDQEVEGTEFQKDPEPQSIAEEIHQQNQATNVEDHGEKTNERTNENQNEGIARDKYERQLTFEDIRIRSNDPLFVENKTTQEQEGTVEDAAFEFGLKDEEDEVKSKTSTTATQVEKVSIAEASQQGILGFEEANETSQDIKKPTEAHLTEEKDSTANKELQAENEGDGEHENVEEVKTDEEKGEVEHENSDSGYDAPVIVEASKDSDVGKVSSHKKSHNILSGIKHSISKVKKAITGKSSHSKIQTEK